MNRLHTPLLDCINTPTDLRKLSSTELPALAQELRLFLIDSVNKTGGHLAAGLGAIEITLALHYLYNTPDDNLIWDTGHQAYPHKILTGRKKAMSELRQKNGLSGFPRRSESQYDSFGVGHSSTSISAGLGMAVANDRLGTNNKTVAIIGDGAMTAGIAFEALNHAGHCNRNILVILNDNNMSISANVGGLSTYLSKILSSHLYTSVRNSGKKVLSHLPPMMELAKRAEEHVKGMVIPSTLFEELGFNYIGPIDGHDLPLLLTTLSNIRQLDGPQFLHIVTHKGKGYAPAEADPLGYHSVSCPAIIKDKAPKIKPQTYTQVFGEWLCDSAAKDPILMAITPAMSAGSGMIEFEQRFPQQFFDVGIAEQHALTFAAGLASSGCHVVVAIYSSFLQRAYDQLIHDIALQNLPLLLAIDRAGPVGADGATHAGSFDISFLRCVPNITLMTPCDENECYQMLATGYLSRSLCAVRYPRGCGPGTRVDKTLEPIPIGKAEKIRQGQVIALLVFGPPLQAALEAAEEIDATVINMRFVKPLDQEMLSTIAKTHAMLVTLEENVIAGGAGSAVNESLHQQKYSNAVLNLGLPDIFQEHDERKGQLVQANLTKTNIIKQITLFTKNKH